MIMNILCLLLCVHDCFVNVQDRSLNPPGGAEMMEDTEPMESGSQKTAGPEMVGCDESTASPTPSPVRMLDVPAFALKYDIKTTEISNKPSRQENHFVLLLLDITTADSDTLINFTPDVIAWGQH